jgi:hypothetical protein
LSPDKPADGTTGQTWPAVAVRVGTSLLRRASAVLGRRCIVDRRWVHGS